MVEGVLDCGVDSQHEELRGKVDGGGDWHGSTRGLEDQFGHGTHVVCRAIELGLTQQASEG
ncbi:MAG: hypothetical protein EBT93_00285 [Alphaproteobacteria bacterium]|nr:hypothetical protein [Alphaproteobacteria bacterium]